MITSLSICCPAPQTHTHTHSRPPTSVTSLQYQARPQSDGISSIFLCSHGPKAHRDHLRCRRRGLGTGHHAKIADWLRSGEDGGAQQDAKRRQASDCNGGPGVARCLSLPSPTRKSLPKAWPLISSKPDRTARLAFFSTSLANTSCMIGMLLRTKGSTS